MGVGVQCGKRKVEMEELNQVTWHLYRKYIILSFRSLSLMFQDVSFTCLVVLYRNVEFSVRSNAAGRTRCCETMLGGWKVIFRVQHTISLLFYLWKIYLRTTSVFKF